MLLRLGTLFIIGVFSINLVTSPLSTPIITHKNCTHVEIQIEVSVQDFRDGIDIFIELSTGLKTFLGAATVISLYVIASKGLDFQSQTELMTSKSTVISLMDPFNLTVIFRFSEDLVQYVFEFSINRPRLVKRTIAVGKSICTPSKTSDIVCENSCLCDTVIYKRCANGGRVNGICSDPGTVFQSPGSLTFNAECLTEATSGIVIGIIIGVIIIAAVVYFVLQKKKKAGYSKSTGESE